MFSLVPLYNTANHYYAGDLYCNFRKISTDSEEFDEVMEQEEKAYKKLRDFIRNDNLSGLINSKEFKSLGVNHQFGYEQKTFLHAAYMFNKPEIVEFLVKNYADERIPDDRGFIPMEVAQDTYFDSLPRVMNEVTQRYFKSLGDSSSNNPHVLFDVIQNFIHEKKWKYFDTEGTRKQIPFRDGRLLSSLGLPELAYHINCADLTNLFIKTAHKIGMDVEEVWYREYSSIQVHEKEKASIIGKLEMFDGSNHSQKDLSIKFSAHSVAYSSGWHFDLTLMCKYQDRNAILMCQR